MWNRYENNLHYPRISENDFDINEYKPFRANSKVATLDTIPTLKLKNNLPVLDGATALYPLYSAFAQAAYPEKGKNKVKYSNTMKAYNALIKRKIDIIFVASPSKEQLEMAEKAEVKLKLIPLAKEAFVFFVNENNPISDLSVSQLQNIYSGKVRNWNKLGNLNDTIIPFQRNIGSGSQTAFINFMRDNEIVTPRKDEIIFGMGMIISRVADYINYSNSIGFSFRYFVNEMVGNEQIKLLNINGFEPDIVSIENGNYPLTDNVYAVTLSDNNKPNVAKLLEWIKSAQGQILIKKVGYCPIKN
jgi:phosphate transport system substrate-binding protein